MADELIGALGDELGLFFVVDTHAPGFAHGGVAPESGGVAEGEESDAEWDGSGEVGVEADTWECGGGAA
ncbi:MAG: hypothetical protein RI897_1385 [Verrucomicrobiota bacterium]